MTKALRIKDLLELTLTEIQDRVLKIRSELKPKHRHIITYSKNYTLSLSNYCQNQCGYCYYNYLVPKNSVEKNTILLSEEEIEAKTEIALKYGCKEALIISGEKPDTFPVVHERLREYGFRKYIDYVQYICKYLLKQDMLPHVNIGLLNYEEMNLLKKCVASMGLMLESTRKDLCTEGGVHEKSPGKKAKKRIKHIKDSGKLKIPFTTGLLLGIGETMEDRIDDLFLIKEINKKYGHIQEVIIQNFMKKPHIPYQPSKMISIKEMLRVVGIAKIIFQNEIALQVPPNLISGYQKDFLKTGIDDFGGISPITIDYINPEERWPQISRLAKICKKNGFILQERLPIYEKYIDDESFCPNNIQKIVKFNRKNVFR
ncbi:MAG: 7,8-didemethyl-8-hydroxy-5-deazariboflavin synthase subunit CofG [Candidatus Lokiarchaeota archaeon]|nr:7,8-didemethyl-8-hydroxy-5-deazariboflavin synthase subunit CofG [Candidatus Lokiarchaeota archaeon]